MEPILPLQLYANVNPFGVRSMTTEILPRTVQLEVFSKCSMYRILLISTLWTSSKSFLSNTGPSLL